MLKNAITEFLALSRKPASTRFSVDARAAHAFETLPSEELFEALLVRERRRAERSGRSLVLMLVRALDQAPGRDESARERLLLQAAAVAAKHVRETDLAGWYQQDAVVGVLFTELGSANSRSATIFIEKKMRAALSAALPRVHCLHIAFYSFPEEFDGQNTRRGCELSLYPDYRQITRQKRAHLTVKRLIDILGSALALLLLAPLLLLIALAIKCTSAGPVLFAQDRIGRFNASFRFLKFRSMRVSNDSSVHQQFVSTFIAGADSGQVAAGNRRIFKIISDPRVTSVGRILRRTSLDELPQLWNVLRGEMSLVGPRPPIRYELDAYQLWHRRRLLECKPGITGLWQVRGRSRTTFDDMVRLDLQYFRRWSLWLDLRILLETPRVVLSGDGAY